MEIDNFSKINLTVGLTHGDTEPKALTIWIIRISSLI